MRKEILVNDTNISNHDRARSEKTMGHTAPEFQFFDKPASGPIAVKVINHLGDEVMKVFEVE